MTLSMKWGPSHILGDLVTIFLGRKADRFEQNLFPARLKCVINTTSWGDNGAQVCRWGYRITTLNILKAENPQKQLKAKQNQLS